MPDPNTAPAAPNPNPALEAERARIAAITARCKEVGRPEIALSMIESGADLDTTNKAIVEAWVAQGGPEIINAIPTYPTHSRSDQFANAIESALSARLGIRNAEAPREFQHMSLTQIAGTVIESNGGSARGLNPDRLIRNAMTSSDFPSLLGSAVNRALVAQFQELANEHRQLVATRDLNNFKPGKSISVSAFPSLKEKPEAGEITYSSLTDNAESIQLKTFARGLSLSREAMINDDLGGLARTIQSAALAAIRLERDLVFGALVDNPKLADKTALFASGHANIETGALDLAGLSAARAKMRKQKDRDGNFIVVQPALLVVPVALETAAEALVASLLTKSETRESAAPSWITSLTVVTDPRLDAASETTWYLMANPNSAPVLELAFLQGVQSPVVEESPDFDSDTTRFKVRYDLGIAPIDHRGAVRVTAG